MQTLNRSIRSQGDFDGACFLYSLVNAVYCLTGRQIEADGWARVVSEAYDARDFLNGQIGTAKIDNLPSLLSTLAMQYLRALDQITHYDVELVEGIKKVGDLQRTLSSKSVLLVDNGSHWFCLVDFYDDTAFAACSAALQDDPCNYSEMSSNRLRIIYNVSFPKKHLKFHKNRAFLISVQ